MVTIAAWNPDACAVLAELAAAGPERLAVLVVPVGAGVVSPFQTSRSAWAGGGGLPDAHALAVPDRRLGVLRARRDSNSQPSDP
jgi:hypothetical protein